MKTSSKVVNLIARAGKWNEAERKLAKSQGLGWKAVVEYRKFWMNMAWQYK